MHFSARFESTNDLIRPVYPVGGRRRIGSRSASLTVAMSIIDLARWLALSGVWGSLWRIRLAGPVFRFGDNPLLRLFLSGKIANVRFGAEAGRYRNEPAAAFIQFRMKRRRFSHARICARHHQFSNPERCLNRTDPLPAPRAFVLSCHSYFPATP